MSMYLLGLVTLPALGLLGCALLGGWVLAVHALGRRGITLEARRHRRVDEHRLDYILRRDVWWERAWGPVFVGGWCRERPEYDEPTSDRIIGRWIGFGSTHGPCLSIIRTRNLGKAS